MVKRLQVLLPETELRDIQRLARSRHQTTAEWVRHALRVARDRPGPSVADKLAAIGRAAASMYPTADIDTMLGDIERGYVGPER